MEISHLPSTVPSKSNIADAPVNILNRLQQLGSVPARVVSVTNGQATLSTRLGEITSSNALKLKAGDTVQIRLDSDGKKTVLKVTPSQDQVTLLAANKFLKLLALLPANRPTAATVVSHKGNNTLLQLGSTQTSIPLQPQLKAGQLINIIHRHASATIEIKQVDHQQVLRSALAQLVSARPQSSVNNQLRPLLQLVQSVLRVNTEQTPAISSTNSSHHFLNTDSSTANRRNALPNNIIPTLASGLELLIRSLPTVTSLNQRTIQKLVELATHSTLGSKAEKGFSNLNPLSVLRQLPQTEQGLHQLIQSFLKTNQERANTEVRLLKKASINNDEALLTQFRDAIRSTEQSLNQQLFQQTTLRLQQELQQPIAFNLNIPYMEEQTVKSLQLRIRQKSKEASTENQGWEIRLSFEFGSLGLISTHILLDGDTLSSSFWAVEESTKNKIHDALPDFKRQLAKSGFTLGSFFCYLGQPPQESDNAFSPVPDSLLDIEV
ncbi:MAG: hypothetical protein ACI8XX_000360 [Polaribacter sp.]|jgi:hypothetical protein